MSQPTLIAPGAADPLPGLSYPLALRRDGYAVVHTAFGVLLAFVSFAVVVPVLAQGIMRLGFSLSGAADWEAYRAAAGAYELPIGPAASNLALAALAPLGILLVRFVHGIRPRWAWSVQPGFRWRYAAIVLVAAAVILNAVLWLKFLVVGVPAFHEGQPGWAWFALAVVCASPLQALAEEVFFRGYLLQTIGSATGRAWLGVVGSALIFALLHGVQNPALFAHRLAFGLIAGALVVLTGGLEAGIAAHIVNNLGAYGYALFTSSLAQLRAITGITWGEAAFDIAGFALFAVLAYWLGRRLNLATRTP